jgi:hypothetical protein
VFLRFTNFYYHFIFKYLAITALITDLLKRIKKKKKKGLFKWTKEAL